MTDATDLPQLDAGHVTIRQATELFDVGGSTLRRRLRSPEGVPGAEQVPSPSGDTWILPADWLAANYPRRDHGQGMVSTSPPELDRLVALVEQLTAQLGEAHQRALDAAQAQLQLVEDTAVARTQVEAAKAEADRLRAELHTMTTELADVRAELVQARRRWWRRG